MKIKNYFCITGLLFSFLTGCNNVGAGKVNDANWSIVGIGQDKTVVIKVMGEPSEFSNNSVLGVEHEKLTWKSYFPSREYKAEFVMGRLITKDSSKENFF